MYNSIYMRGLEICLYVLLEFRPSFFLQPIETHLGCLSQLPLQGKIYFFLFICIFSVAAIIWKEIV